MNKISIFEVSSVDGKTFYEIRRENGFVLGSSYLLSDILLECWHIISVYGLCLVDNSDMSLPVVHSLYVDCDGNKSISSSEV